MSILELKCPNCGGDIKLDQSKDFGFCMYCGTKIQITEKVRVEHGGTISVNGLTTVESLCKKGYMEIDSKNFISASITFDKGAEIDCNYIYVIIGKMLVKPVFGGRDDHVVGTIFDEFYYKRLAAISQKITEQEISVINKENSKMFLKCYLLFKDRNRAEYVINNYPDSIDMSLLDYRHIYDGDYEYFIGKHSMKIEKGQDGYSDGEDHMDNREELVNKFSSIVNFGNEFDLVPRLLKNGVSNEEVFDRLYYAAYMGELSNCSFDNKNCSRDTFYLKAIPLKVLKELIESGLSPQTRVWYRTHHYDKGTMYNSYSWMFAYLKIFFSLTQGRLNFIEDEDGDKLEDYIKYMSELSSTKSSSKSGSKSGSKGGCYIATAVYGSYDCPQVWTLRRYRDNVLSTTLFGRAFISTYYAISPIMVRWFKNTRWFKSFWRGVLDNFVAKLQQKGLESTPYEDNN